MKEYHSLLVLRLVLITCFLHLNFGKGLDLLFDLLGQKNITELLPWEFYDALRRRQRNNRLNIDVNLLADAFKKIGNPLVIVSMHGNCPKFGCKDAIFVDMKLNPCKEELLRILFPKTGCSQYQTAGFSCEVLLPANYNEGTSSDVVPFSSSVSLSDQDLNTQNQNVGDLQFNHDRFWEIIEALTAVDGIKDLRTFISYASTLMVFLGKLVSIIDAGTKEYLLKKPAGGEDDDFSRDAMSVLNLMNQLHSELEPSKLKLECSVPIIGALCEELRSGWSIMMPLLQQQGYLVKDGNHASEESGDHCDVEESISRAQECSKGKKPASATTFNSKPQGNSKSKKNKKSRGRRALIRCA